MTETNRWSIEGNIVDPVAGRVFPGRIEVEQGHIARITEERGKSYATTLTPGLVDAHVHVESSMLSPAEFGRVAAIHGTVASVSDPHEIANVLGIEGVRWMIENAERTPFKIYYGAPSCVPATPFETAGAQFGPDEVDELLADDRVLYLSEVMNFPAVIHRDPTLMAIVERARARGKRIDGHAPGVIGDDLRQYAAAGIGTDHECSTLEEGRQRCQLGMRVAIREGSAARNFEALWPLLKEFPEKVFFCSDDKHPDDLVKGHIDQLVARAIAKGIDPMVAIRAASLNPVRHYGLQVGLLQEGDPADFAERESLQTMRALRCWIDGKLVGEAGRALLPHLPCQAINRFAASPKKPEDFTLPHRRNTKPRRVMVALDGELLTGETEADADAPDPSADLLQITVVNRYGDTPPASALIKGFGLRHGAMASSVAHDSHNIVAVGTDANALTGAVNAVIRSGGGLSFYDGQQAHTLDLPIAGLMTDREAWEVGAQFESLTALAKEAGCTLGSPFMTLSFMALLVIPSLKLSDRGLFDAGTFSLVTE